ncbi:MAG: hypothetical protein JW787_07530 [Sedimentisphaerales bacterium]|nr:hypothetical protein [Sedimentisphaerales bacterium]
MREINMKIMVVFIIITILSYCSSKIYAENTSIEPGYVIFTVAEINNLSLKLPDFIAHKESLGFNVRIVTEDDYGGGVEDTAAFNIREWLKSHYESDNIKYVLLIGDTRLENNEIPMKLFCPFGKKYSGILSDIYYAALTFDWDLDGDGYCGELDDFERSYRSGKNPNWEVIVGRIPCYKGGYGNNPYDDSIPDLDNILQKTIDYERQTIDANSIDWRKNALLAMSYSVKDIPDAELIKTDIFDESAWNVHRVYTEECISRFPQYHPETYGSSIETVCRVWDSNTYGLVLWASEKNPDVNNIYIKEPNLPCEYFPSFMFQPAYSPADSDNPENLTYTMLKKINAGAVCSAAVNINLNVSDMDLAYQYILRVTSCMTAGEALLSAKEKLFSPGTPHLYQLFAFNFYGDPSLKLLLPEEKIIIYADLNASGKNDGTSWEDAFNSLQDALHKAMKGDEIRIAQGTYTPCPNSSIPSDISNQKSSFYIKNDIVVKGGYAGVTHIDPNERNPELYQTILSGEIGNMDTLEDNCYHVVTVRDLVFEISTIDGLIISGGYAHGTDTYETEGGGLFIDGGLLKINNCIFENNSADYGGAIYARDGCLSIDNSLFRYNCASRNTGAISSASQSLLEIVNSSFYQNTAEFWTSTISSSSNKTNIINCTFSNNTAMFSDARVISNSGDSFLLKNSILYGNFPDMLNIGDDPNLYDVRYCDIKGGWVGMGNIDIDPLFADPDNDDYHLKSQEGRWESLSQTWVQDSVTSPCIDAGDPNDAVGNENAPNGSIINMGAYGGKDKASKTYITPL